MLSYETRCLKMFKFRAKNSQYYTCWFAWNFKTLEINVSSLRLQCCKIETFWLTFKLCVLLSRLCESSSSSRTATGPLPLPCKPRGEEFWACVITRHEKCFFWIASKELDERRKESNVMEWRKFVQHKQKICQILVMNDLRIVYWKDNTLFKYFPFY